MGGKTLVSKELLINVEITLQIASSTELYFNFNDSFTRKLIWLIYFSEEHILTSYGLKTVIILSY